MRARTRIFILFVLQLLWISNLSAQVSPKDFIAQRKLMKFCRSNMDAPECVEMKRANDYKQALEQHCRYEPNDELCVKARQKNRADLEQLCIERPDYAFCKKRQGSKSVDLTQKQQLDSETE